MTHKLLLADDSVTIQRVVELTFSGEDVQVVTVGDGEQAIARIPIERPDVVLADIGMPKRSGYEVAAFVKGRPDLAHIPVLLLAGAFEPVDEGRAQQVDCDGVLVKPFEPQQVIARVKELIDRPAAVASPGGAVASSDIEPGSPEEPPASPSGAPDAAPERQAPAAAPAHPPRGETILDDYFERLDAAFARLGEQAERQRPRGAGRPDEDRLQVPTLEGVLRSLHGEAAPALPGDPTPGGDAASRGPAVATAAAQSPEPRNLVADMFAALFAMEQGETVTPASPAKRSDDPPISDAFVDEVTRRVIARLAPDAASSVVAQIVSDVAERLVREEIARIKSGVATELQSP